MACQRAASPVFCYLRKQAVLYCVPFARSRREVAYRDLDVLLIRQSLYGHLPKMCAVAIAPAGIRSDQELLGPGVRFPTHLPPPCANGLHGKLRRVMVFTDAPPAFIAPRIVNSVRSGSAYVLVREVVGLNFLRLTFLLPLAAPVFGGPDELLLLCRRRRENAVNQPV